jgi:hypothetical protein
MIITFQPWVPDSVFLSEIRPQQVFVILMTVSLLINFGSSHQPVRAQSDKKSSLTDWSSFRKSIVAAKPGSLEGFKSFEIYSWSIGGKWHYSMLPGTDRNKVAAEVTEAGITLTNLNKLESALGKLAPNTDVFWYNTVADKTGANKFSYPHQAVVNAVKKYAAGRQIRLVTMMDMGR